MQRSEDNSIESVLSLTLCWFHESNSAHQSCMAWFKIFIYIIHSIICHLLHYCLILMLHSVIQTDI